MSNILMDRLEFGKYHKKGLFEAIDHNGPIAFMEYERAFGR